MHEYCFIASAQSKGSKKRFKYLALSNLLVADIHAKHLADKVYDTHVIASCS